MSRGRQKRVRGDAVWQATRAWLQRTNLWRQRTDLRTESERLRGVANDRPTADIRSHPLVVPPVFGFRFGPGHGYRRNSTRISSKPSSGCSGKRARHARNAKRIGEEMKPTATPLRSNRMNRKEVIENAKGDVCSGRRGRGFHDAAIGQR